MVNEVEVAKVCLVDGKPIEGMAQYVFVTGAKGGDLPTRVPGLTCINHHNQMQRDVYVARVVMRVMDEYRRIVDLNTTDEYSAREAVAFDKDGMLGAYGEVLDLAYSMGFREVEGFGDDLREALADALDRYQVHLRAGLPLPQQAPLPVLLERFDAWRAQRVSLSQRENEETPAGEPTPDEWHQSNDDGTELLEELAGVLASGPCKHDNMTYNGVSGVVSCEGCLQTWPTWVIG